MQEKFDKEGRLITYRFEKLVENPSNAMKILSKKLGTNYENILTSPTLCGKKWLGNSQQGQSSGINSKPNEYFKKILREDEIKLIKNKIKNTKE